MSTNTTTSSPWLDRKAAADYLGVTEDTPAQMATRGTGPRYSKPSERIVRYHRDELDAWLERFARTGTRDGAA
jgi:predicted DNA-binding transcriptional regulator AlpA